MHEIAEKGYAAHYKYKTRPNQKEIGIEEWLNKLQEALENANTNAVDFRWGNLNWIFTPKKYLFYPQGEFKILTEKFQRL